MVHLLLVKVAVKHGAPSREQKYTLQKMDCTVRSLSLHFPRGFPGSLALNVLASFLSRCHARGLQNIHELALGVGSQVQRKGVNGIDSPTGEKIKRHSLKIYIHILPPFPMCPVWISQKHYWSTQRYSQSTRKVLKKKF